VGNAEVTYRNYLVDSRFVVLLEGYETLLGEVEEALTNPVWFGTLGRRSCVPAARIFLGRFDSETDALEFLSQRIGSVQIYLRVDEVKSGGVLLRDLPMSFSSRTHGQRMIRVIV
jgi:hypothetical protein